MVVGMMEDLWENGLAGKWVLHGEGLYLPVYDTRPRGDGDGEGDSRSGHVIVDSDLDLRFDTRFKPPPLNSLGSVAYWEQKKAELRKKRDDVVAGRLVTHHFSKGELMRIELLERANAEELEQSTANPTHQRAEQVAAWLDLNRDTEETTTAAPLQQLPARNSEALKRKRTADYEPEPRLGRAIQHPAKRSRVQQEPSPRKNVPQALGSSQTAPDTKPKTRNHASTEHGTQASAKVTHKGRGVEVQHTPRKRRKQGERGGLSADRPSPRRSARISAQLPKSDR
ncbi:hypothetical protein F503_04871 [Ophiostoma piceae UAMH 11346]|uniref:Uncharacterized protein n=1 Tax=Ophiostoma piceae (strain UAMH 11346) TaxID=1262450 RepID=S3CCH1_OPHP1|nr:hypothetical protein F503_04871 [Ophiostoma piceae UAMH 11346]